MSVFVHAQGIKTVHAGGGVKKWQNSVHVVVECPPSQAKSLHGQSNLGIPYLNVLVNFM